MSPKPTQLYPGDFLSRFTSAEQAAVQQAAINNAQIALGLTMGVAGPFEIPDQGRREFVSDRWFLRHFVIAVAIFAMSMAAAILLTGTHAHRTSPAGHYARVEQEVGSISAGGEIVCVR